MPGLVRHFLFYHVAKRSLSMSKKQGSERI